MVGCLNGWLPCHRLIELGLERGQAYKEIATALNLSPHTVNTHVKHIYEKLHARSRQEALRTARQRDWL